MMCTRVIHKVQHQQKVDHFPISVSVGYHRAIQPRQVDAGGQPVIKVNSPDRTRVVNFF
jgi:hypothetical protein